MMRAPAFLYDDAYITLASAQSLLAGHDAHFIGTPALYGVTSPVHCVLVAGLLLVLPPLWALMVSSVLGAGAYAWGLCALCRHERCPLLETICLVTAGLGAGMLSQHMVNGLETSWALAGVTWLLLWSRQARIRRVAVIAGVLPFVRPELAILSGLVLGWHAWKQPTARRGLALMLVAAAAALPWLVLLVWQTGSWAPTTLAAKRDWYAEGCWPWRRRAGVVWTGLAGWAWTMGPIVLGVIPLCRSTLGRLALLAAVVVVIVWAYSVPDVLHSYQRHRYYAPFVPLLIFGAATAWHGPRRWVALGAVVMAALSVAAVFKFEPAAIANAERVRTEVAGAVRQAGASRVLLHDAGYLAWSGAAPIGIDMVGLKSPAAAALHREYSGPSCGGKRGEALAILASRTRPTHLVIWGPWDDFFGVTRALRDHGWRVSRAATIANLEPVYVYALQAP